VLTPEVAQHVQTLFDDRNATTSSIGEALPATAREMFAPAMSADIAAGRPTWFQQALAENSLDEWTPRAPVRFYYGAADTEVSPQDSIQAAEQMHARGADAESVNVGDIGHEPSLFASVPLIITWLDELEAARSPG
jgi:pimeloyl-ACP methyl ester carboxylesterase